MNNDVCLIVEGSYPYLTGGVSAWVDGLVRGLDDVRFIVAHLRDDAAPAPVYRVPDSVSVVDVAPGEALPDASAYHALSTGAAGVAGARAAAERGAPFLLTEHGLAAREAALGIVGCKPGRRPPGADPLELRMHAGEIAAQAREAYAAADAIVSVCDANARAQVRAGAPRERVRVVPNGVAASDAQPREGDAFRVGFVGRVVPVKDLATFLRAAATVAVQRPRSEFVIVGPTDHDTGYVERCRRLAAELEIGPQVTFTGEADPGEWYPRLDVVALTSVSEAQPLVLLEAMAAGRPVVTTAVGGCAELAAGAGFIVPPRDPAAAARALLALADDPALRRRLGAAGRERARSQHHPAAFARSYRRLYAEALET
jgi:glycosyltransferase involved in cell wall biosynthesis